MCSDYASAEQYFTMAKDITDPAEMIVLYDIPSRHGSCWSWNTWRTRLVLNYKGLPYRTIWLEYPDIAPTLQSLGISAHKDVPAYTLPAITLSDGRHIMGSMEIAQELDRLSPTPSLQLDLPVVAQVETIVNHATRSYPRVYIPRIIGLLLNEPSVAYITKNYLPVIGGVLPDIADEVPAAMLEEVKGILRPLTRLKKAEGRFFLGLEPSYADVLLGAFLQSAKMLSRKEDLFEQLSDIDEFFGNLMENLGGVFDRVD